MRIFRRISSGAVLIAAVSSFEAEAQPASNSVLTGEWDFNQGNLKATVGQDLQFVGNSASTTTFEQRVVNGRMSGVMEFSDLSEGYLMFHGAQPNGGGTNVNVYTVVMDLMWPAASDGTFRALLNSDTNNVQEPIMFVNPDNAIGVNNHYAGEMLSDTWYRVGLSFNLTNATVSKYLNGEPLGSQPLESGVDSRYSLSPAALLFTSNAGEIRTGLVDRIQFYSDALSDEQVKGLGTPIGDGGPPVTGSVRIDHIEKVGGDVKITISGGGTLQLQQAAQLVGAPWKPVGQVTDAGTLSVPATGATGFFRVQRL